MSVFNCFFEHTLKFSVGVAIFLIGLGLSVIGLTILPVVGLLAAVPVLAISFYFMGSHLNGQCEIPSG